MRDAALAAAVAIDHLTFWLLPDPFLPGVAPLTLRPTITWRLVAPVFSMVGGAVHNDVGLIVHDRSFDFVHPGMQDAPLTAGAEILPYHAVRAAMAARVQPYLDIMGAVRRATDGAVYHMQALPACAAERVPNDDPSFAAYWGADRRITGVWLRHKLWTIQADLVREACTREGMIHVDVPAAARTAEGFLQPAYMGPAAHGNAAYGALVLAQMQDIAARALCGAAPSL